MKRFILIIVALAFAAVVSGTNLATAKPGQSGKSNPGSKTISKSVEPKIVNTIHPVSPKGSNHNMDGKGSKNDHRFGRDYRNWSRYCWFPDCGAYGFCSGDDGQWYYWYEPLESYLPVSRMSELAPTGTPPDPPPGAVPVK